MGQPVPEEELKEKISGMTLDLYKYVASIPDYPEKGLFFGTFCH